MTFLERDLLEQINQFREELEDQKKAYTAAEKENAVRRDIMMQLREENAKLVKALERIGKYASEMKEEKHFKEPSFATFISKIVLSEIGGTQ